MDAGKRGQRITIQQRSVTRNALGNEVEAWDTHSRPWARVIEEQGREYLKGDIKAESKAVFVIRYRQLDTTCRVLWGERVFTVEQVTGTRREGDSWLHCRSIAGAG